MSREEFERLAADLDAVSEPGPADGEYGPRLYWWPSHGADRSGGDVTLEVDDSPEDLSPVHAHLGGHPFDLEALSGLFDTGETGVMRKGNAWVMFGPALDAAWDRKSAGITDVATRLLRSLNGIARAVDDSFSPVRLTGRYDGPGNSVEIIAVDVAVEREQAGVVQLGDDAPPTPGPGAAILATATHEKDLADAVMLLGTPAAEVDWFDLWKVFEVVREAAGGSQALVSGAWATRDDFARFKASANDPVLSGEAARHARHSPTNVARMSLGEARRLVSQLVRRLASEREAEGTRPPRTEPSS